jgi:uncharacterized damage-inducible protein DinB
VTQRRFLPVPPRHLESGSDAATPEKARTTLDILDRLLGHDEWTTHQALGRCRELIPAQLVQPFDIGHGTIEQTLLHMIGNIEVWTDLMRERPPRTADTSPHSIWTLDDLRTRFDAAYADFADVARRVADANRLDETYLDVLDSPPKRKTYGATIVHIVTHDMLHRGELLHMLARLGMRDLPEGDALSWEAQRLHG